MKNFVTCIFAFLLVVACSSTPKDVMLVDAMPDIYPDYIGVTIPAGIAPMNFNCADADVECVDVVVTGSKGGSLHTNGDYADFDVDDWHAITEQNKGGELTFTVCMKRNGRWTQYNDFKMFVSNYPLDDYGLTYRKIAPGYEVYCKIGNYQRNIHNFDEEPIIENTAVQGQCMSCHTANQTNPEQFFFHLRGKHGCTLIQRGGKHVWYNAKTDSTIANPSYGYWHPSGRYCCFSVNKIHQCFFTGNKSMIEVFDTASDLVVLDVETNQLILSPLLQGSESFETYPVFSPDGKTMYFCVSKAYDMPREYDKAKYNLCKISFDPDKGVFGNKVDTVINAEKMNKSVTFPRPSYDGKFLMYCLSDFGNFPINHAEADLWMLDMRTNESIELKNANSPQSESFHNWSSNSHWFVTASRREDTLYGLLYIACIDDNGNVTKPFLLPQRNPQKFYHESLFSYNVPDFTKSHVDFDVRNAYDEVYSDKRQGVTIK